MNGWRSVPLRAIYQRVELRGRADLPLLSVYRDHGVVPRDERDDNNNRPSDDLSTYKYVRPGDLVVNKMKTWQGSLAVSGHEGIVSPAYFVGRRVTDVDDRFMHHLLRSMPLIAEYGARSKGIRPSQWDLPWDEFAAIKVSLPSAGEQRAIADYLDTETARIDALIAKKQRMIELLDERRQATIRNATTQGLGKACTDDGLVEARGFAAPVHWTVAPLSTLCAFQTGKAHEPYIDEDGEFICVNSRFISTDGQVVKRCNRNLSPARPTDVLMVMSDLPNGRALARAFYVEDADTYAVNQRVCIISPRVIHPRYAYYQLDRNPGFLRFDDGSNQTHLSNSVFRKFMMCVPPQEEQRAIAEYLDAVTGSIRSASQGLATQISLLREQRQALITAVVTGEFEVPGVAA